MVTNPWLRRFLDLECFVLSGMLAADTITAEMAFMFHERNAPGATIDYPRGGSEALLDALVRGIEKNGGRVELRAHVDEILLEGGRAAGVRLQPRGGRGAQPEVRPSHASVRAVCFAVLKLAGGPHFEARRNTWDLVWAQGSVCTCRWCARARRW